MRGWVVVIIAIVCLIVGGIGGAMLGGGAGAGFGIVAGLLSGSQAGVCLAVETAKEQGYLPRTRLIPLFPRRSARSKACCLPI